MHIRHARNWYQKHGVRQFRRQRCCCTYNYYADDKQKQTEEWTRFTRCFQYSCSFTYRSRSFDFIVVICLLPIDQQTTANSDSGALVSPGFWWIIEHGPSFWYQNRWHTSKVSGTRVWYQFLGQSAMGLAVNFWWTIFCDSGWYVLQLDTLKLMVVLVSNCHPFLFSRKCSWTWILLRWCRHIKQRNVIQSFLCQFVFRCRFIQTGWQPSQVVNFSLWLGSWCWASSLSHEQGTYFGGKFFTWLICVENLEK